MKLTHLLHPFSQWTGGALQRASLRLTLLCGLCLLVLRAVAAAESPLDVAVRAARWQLSQMDLAKDELRRWEHAVFWIGMTDLADMDSTPPEIREVILEIGRRYSWQKIYNRPFSADDQAMTQAYLWMARNGAGREALAPTIAIFDRVVTETPRVHLAYTLRNRPHSASPPPDDPPQPDERWSWVDALFMAPPAMFELSRQTGDPRYRDHALREWWAATDFLYNPVEKLYFRDSRFFELRDERGRLSFWSRGNGWAFGGLVRSLRWLDTDDPGTARMRGLFVEMAERLVELQKEDGYWSPSLLSPEGSLPETSGTGFFVYGLAWGINAGLLERERFEPAMRKGWAALLRAVHPSGKLGYVQVVADRPGEVGEDDTQYYGVGALLMAACEITRLDASK